MDSYHNPLAAPDGDAGHRNCSRHRHPRTETNASSSDSISYYENWIRFWNEHNVAWRHIRISVLVAGQDVGQIVFVGIASFHSNLVAWRTMTSMDYAYSFPHPVVRAAGLDEHFEQTHSHRRVKTARCSQRSDYRDLPTTQRRIALRRSRLLRLTGVRHDD